MYRCRRFIAIILSLAVVASTFIFSVSAEETEYNNFYITIDNISYALNEGAGFYIEIPANGSKTMTINDITPSQGVHSTTGLTANFIIQTYYYYLTEGNVFIYPTNYSNPTPTDRFSLRFYQRFNDEAQAPLTMSRGRWAIDISYAAITNSSYAINRSVTWMNTSNKTVYLYFAFENVNITFGTTWFMYYLLRPMLQNLYDITTSIYDLVREVRNTYFYNTTYQYDTISYDSYGNAVFTSGYDTWANALLFTLKSILAPVKEQEEQEQLAKDAGFNDVLVDAYDNSSVSSFYDILAISNLSRWDEGSWEDSMGDSFLYWFSQSCADDIDTVPRTRGEEPQIIDFYSQHINDYWEALGIGTADQGGD